MYSIVISLSSYGYRVSLLEIIDHYYNPENEYYHTMQCNINVCIYV